MIKLYTVTDHLPIIGMDIRGPLSTPVTMKESHVIDMIRRGYHVYQHNPGDKKEKILLTLSNYTSVKFNRGFGYANRKLNRELQEEVASKIIDVVHKNEVKKEKPVVVVEEKTKDQEVKNNKKDEKSSKTEKAEPTKVKGDDFIKS